MVYSKGRDLSHDTAAHLQQADAPAEVWAFDCSPFDIDVSGVFWSPQDKFCTFDVMVEEFSPANEGLPDTVLIRPRDNGALSDLVTLAGASWAFRQ
ncbi:hypothetical protein ACRAWG_36340 [Methylobacterium sp. P31]